MSADDSLTSPYSPSKRKNFKDMIVRYHPKTLSPSSSPVSPSNSLDIVETPVSPESPNGENRKKKDNDLDQVMRLKSSAAYNFLQSSRENKLEVANAQERQNRQNHQKHPPKDKTRSRSIHWADEKCIPLTKVATIGKSNPMESPEIIVRPADDRREEGDDDDDEADQKPFPSLLVDKSRQEKEQVERDQEYQNLMEMCKKFQQDLEMVKASIRDQEEAKRISQELKEKEALLSTRNVEHLDRWREEEDDLESKRHRLNQEIQQLQLKWNELERSSEGRDLEKIEQDLKQQYAHEVVNKALLRQKTEEVRRYSQKSSMWKKPLIYNLIGIAGVVLFSLQMVHKSMYSY